MNLDKLKYSKREAGKDIPAVSSTCLSADEGVNAPLSDELVMPYGYAKEQPTIETQIIFVISGGAKREKDYFKQLLKDRSVKRLKIAFASKEGQGLVPRQMNDLAKGFIQNKRFRTATDSFSIDIDDTLFMLQDIDEFEAEIKDILDNNRVKQTEWIISNPSFEIWLFYHKFGSTNGLLDEGLRKPLSERSQWLKRRLDEVVPGGINPIEVFSSIRTAIDNSKANYSETDGLPALYSTQMHILAERILTILGDEFDDMLKRREERTRIFMSKRITQERDTTL